jgi:hypothetical protein
MTILLLNSTYSYTQKELVITHKNIKDSKVISLTISNLTAMIEMSLDEWKLLMNKNSYTNEGIRENTILYSSGILHIMNNAGGQFFSKSFTNPPLVEYSLYFKYSHYTMKDEVVDFISSISEYYGKTENGWSYYMFTYNTKMYQIALLGDNERCRIVIWSM